MKKSQLGLAFIGAISIIASGCRTSPPVWNGRWRVNEAKSSIPGPSLTIAVLPAGEYQFDNGTYSYSFRCDGKKYTTTGDHMISCVQTSASVIEATLITHETKIGTARWELSDDGRRLTITGTSIQANKSAKSRETTYSRVSGTVGFAGGWKDTKSLESRHQLLLSLDDRRLHIAFSDSGQFSDSPLDGSDARLQGPGAPEGLTIAITPHGPQEFFTTKKLRGKVVNQGSLRLSADGCTLVEEYWRPERPDEKAVLVYERTD